MVDRTYSEVHLGLQSLMDLAPIRTAKVFTEGLLPNETICSLRCLVGSLWIGVLHWLSGRKDGSNGCQ